METRIQQLIDRFTSDDFYVGRNIPPQKLKSAFENYAIPKHENVLALVDATVFGSAKCGMAITTNGIYWNNDWTTPSRIRSLTWSDMAKSNQPVLARSKQLQFGKDAIFSMAGSSMDPELLARLLKDVVDIHKVEDGSATTGATNGTDVSVRQSIGLSVALLENPKWSWQFENVHVRPAIPERKLRGAISSYAQDVNPDDILVLIDDTVFGSAKDGLIVTTNGMFAKSTAGNHRVLFTSKPSITPESHCRTMVNETLFFRGSIVNHLTLLAITLRLKEALSEPLTDPKEAKAQTSPAVVPAKSDNSQTLTNTEAATPSNGPIEIPTQISTSETSFFSNFRGEYPKFLARERFPENGHSLYLELFEIGQRFSSDYSKSRHYAAEMERFFSADEAIFQAHTLVSFHLGYTLTPIMKELTHRHVVPLSMVAFAYAAYKNPMIRVAPDMMNDPIGVLGDTDQMRLYASVTRAYIQIGEESAEAHASIVSGFTRAVHNALRSNYRHDYLAARATCERNGNRVDEYFAEYWDYARNAIERALRTSGFPPGVRN